MKLKNREYAVAVSKIEKHTYDIKQINFETIPNGLDFWVADPFPFEKDGMLYIFGEMYEYTKLKGSIAYTVLTDSGFTKWKKIIEEPYHLSFPNIFIKDNGIYMCPEARQSGELYLYKCIEFPEKWVKEEVLIKNTNCSDTVFWKDDTGNYAFTCEWNGLNDHHMNVISFTDRGPVFAPRENVICLADYYSRPAGKIFYDEVLQQYISVFQNCKPQYGSGLVFKEFNLSFPNYTEKMVGMFTPKDIHCDLRKKFDGVHTFNMSEHYLVIDVIWSRFNFIEKTSRLLRKFIKRGRK